MLVSCEEGYRNAFCRNLKPDTLFLQRDSSFTCPLASKNEAYVNLQKQTLKINSWMLLKMDVLKNLPENDWNSSQTANWRSVSTRWQPHCYEPHQVVSCQQGGHDKCLLCTLTHSYSRLCSSFRSYLDVRHTSVWRVWRFSWDLGACVDLGKTIQCAHR